MLGSTIQFPFFGRIWSRSIQMQRLVTLSSAWSVSFLVSFTSALNRSVQKSPIQVLLNDRDPVRWYESVKSTILQVVGLVNGPATR